MKLKNERPLEIKGNRRPDYLPENDELPRFNNYNTSLADRDKLEILEWLFNNCSIEELKNLQLIRVNNLTKNFLNKNNETI